MSYTYYYDKNITDTPLFQIILNQKGFNVNYVNYNGLQLEVVFDRELTLSEKQNLDSEVENFIEPVSYSTDNTKVLSTINSCTTLLACEQEFVGTFEYVFDYPDIIVNCFSNVSSDFNGLKLEFSLDGINVHYTKYYTLIANVPISDIFDNLTYKFLRVKYKNSCFDQNIFNLEIVYSRIHLSHSREVKIKEEFVDPTQTPTGGYFKAEGLEILCASSTTTTLDFSWKYPISIGSLELLTKEIHIGDKVNIYVSPETIVGYLTNTATTDSYTIHVNESVIQYIKTGFKCCIIDSENNVNDLGEVLSINPNNLTINIETRPVIEFPPGSLVRMTIQPVKNYLLDYVGKNIIGSNFVGCSYVKENTIIRFQYTNNSNIEKKICCIIEYMY